MCSPSRSMNALKTNDITGWNNSGTASTRFNVLTFELTNDKLELFYGNFASGSVQSLE